MKLGFTVKNKMTIAIMLFCIMACSILIRVLEDKNIKDMNIAFISMYNDRLIPATDLFYLAESVYAKRYLLEEALYNTDSITIDHSYLKGRLALANTNIDSLIRKYEQTFLIAPEKKQLDELKIQLADTRKIEDKVLDYSDQHRMEAARGLFENQGKTAFNAARQKLTELTKIQTEVGQELIKNSAFAVSGTKIYSSLQLALAIVIGILIVAIVFASNVVKIPNDKFNLN
ncbi:MCP four helix bundle domain-containing protein [Pedobacter immunditicola]|uniref:MCP four helix bundle domain-containing protein n=1 Tax=Pedobacter immunditicola TaxID=3133440 RepID=UPI00309CCBCF